MENKTNNVIIFDNKINFSEQDKNLILDLKNNCQNLSLDIIKSNIKEALKIAKLMKEYNLSLAKKECFVIPFKSFNKTSLQLIIAYPTFIQKAKQMNKNYYSQQFFYNIEPKDITDQNLSSLVCEVKLFDKKGNILTNHFVAIKNYLKGANSIWTQQPFVMLQKVALVQALRLIGTNLGGYIKEEMIEEKLNELPENKTQESAQKSATEALKIMEENK